MTDAVPLRMSSIAVDKEEDLKCHTYIGDDDMPQSHANNFIFRIIFTLPKHLA